MGEEVRLNMYEGDLRVTFEGKRAGCNRVNVFDCPREVVGVISRLTGAEVRGAESATWVTVGCGNTELTFFVGDE